MPCWVKITLALMVGGAIGTFVAGLCFTAAWADAVGWRLRDRKGA